MPKSRLATVGLTVLGLHLASCASPEGGGGAELAATRQAVSQTGSQSLPAASITWQLPELAKAPSLGIPVLGFEGTSVGSRAVVRDEGDTAEGVLAALGGSGIYVDTDTTIGTLWSVGRIELRDRVTVAGEVHGTSLVKMNQVTVQGVTDLVTPPTAFRPLLVTYPAAAAAPTYWMEPGQSVQLSPQRYGTLRVPSNATATLTSGEYFFESVQLESGSSLQLSTATGPILLHVRGQLIWRGEVVNATGSNLLVAYDGGSEVVLDSALAGGLLAPGAKVSLRQGPSHKGAVMAREVDRKSVV